jgi:hypothetical protein
MKLTYIDPAIQNSRRAEFSDLYYRLGRLRETLARRVQSFDAAMLVHDEARAVLVAQGIVNLLADLADTIVTMRHTAPAAFGVLRVLRERTRAPLTPRPRTPKSRARSGRAK